ncbi:anthocyanidin 3-O-glucosyltransferase 5-like [Fagus crenata]
MDNSSKPHGVLVFSPGIGHLVCDLELGNRLAADHNLHVTFFVVVETHSSVGESELVQIARTWKLLDIIELPPVDISGQLQPNNTPIFTRLTAVMCEIIPTLRSVIPALKLSPTALIMNFICSSAWAHSLILYAHVLDKEIKGDYVAQKESLRLPGCMPVRPEDLLDLMKDRTNQEYNVFLQTGLKMRETAGFLVNTWEDLEATTLKALREEECYGFVPVYPIGPLFRPVRSSSSRNGLLDWLDKQPVKSVFYIAFGNSGPEVLSAQQITEMAWGLELSQQRFIWVLCPPSKKDELPDGFLARTHNLGLVVTQWAPQLEILGHPSTGGFLSHCGWNSSLESILNGVPMIAWPLYAEQKMNAAIPTEELGVAVEEIEMMVRKVIIADNLDGKAIRTKVKELQNSGKKAWTEGGSSFNALSQLAKQCKMNSQAQRHKLKAP